MFRPQGWETSLVFPLLWDSKSSLLANPIDSKTCPCRTLATPHYQQPGVSHQYTSPGPPHCSLSSLVASYSSFCTQQPKWSFKTGKPGPIPPYLYPSGFPDSSSADGVSRTKWSQMMVLLSSLIMSISPPYSLTPSSSCWVSGLAFAELVLCHHSDLNSLSPSREAFPMAPGTPVSLLLCPPLHLHTCSIPLPCFISFVALSLLEGIMLICFLFIIYLLCPPLNSGSVRAEILTHVRVHRSTDE